ncbi:MAG: hypothetical protein ACHP79_04745, partial [Terriglobales bacterium]
MTTMVNVLRPFNHDALHLDTWDFFLSFPSLKEISFAVLGLNARYFAPQIPFLPCRNRILCGAMAPGLKSAFLLLVIYGILYLLIFPLPEIG